MECLRAADTPFSSTLGEWPRSLLEGGGAVAGEEKARAWRLPFPPLFSAIALLRRAPVVCLPGRAAQVHLPYAVRVGGQLLGGFGLHTCASHRHAQSGLIRAIMSLALAQLADCAWPARKLMRARRRLCSTTPTAITGPAGEHRELRTHRTARTTPWLEPRLGHSIGARVALLIGMAGHRLSGTRSAKSRRGGAAELWAGPSHGYHRWG